MDYLIIAILILVIILLEYLNQPVKQTVVKPVIDGQVKGELLSTKRRWEVEWDGNKFLIGMLAGVIVGLPF